MLELLVVFAMMTIMTVFVVPSVSSYFKVSLSTATREMASIVREGYNATVVTRRVNRVVYDFKERQYWVEGGPPNTLLEIPDDSEQKEFRRQSNRSKRQDEKESAPVFSMNSIVTRKKIQLPEGVEFEDIITSKSKEPITEGFAYTHFFPHGTSEKTIIHLRDQSNHKVSLIVLPLTGKTKLIEGYVTEQEAYAQ